MEDMYGYLPFRIGKVPVSQSSVVFLINRNAPWKEGVQYYMYSIISAIYGLLNILDITN